MGLQYGNQGVTITNFLGDNIVDPTGLNSISSFNNARETVYDIGTAAGTAYYNIPGGTIAPLVLSRDTNAFVYLDVYCYNNAIASLKTSRFYVYDDFDSYRLFYLDNPGQLIGTSSQYLELYLGNIAILLAGTHNLNIQHTNTGGTTTYGYLQLGYIQLGQ